MRITEIVNTKDKYFEELINHMLGSIDEFQKLIKEKGNDFRSRGLLVLYDKDENVHYLYCVRNNNMKNEISKLESEAVSILDQLFKIPEGYSNGLNRRLVECIISAAILEITNQNKKVIE